MREFIVRLFASSDTNHLIKRLIKDYEEAKVSLGVFGQYTIAVPNRSMENWLSAQIVKCTGISSGIRFESLHGLLNKVHKQGSEKHAELVSKDQLAGIIFNTLSDLRLKNLSSDVLGIVEDWLSKQHQPQSLANLSHTLADVYELYQNYRPDWLDAWNRRAAAIGGEAENWQAEIWRLITQQLPEGVLLHRRARTAAFDQSTHKEVLQNGLHGYRQLSIFGVSQLDSDTLEQLEILSSIIPVKCYWLTPSKALFGGEHEAENNKKLTRFQQAYFNGNTLLASWGGLSRQQFLAFEQRGIDCSIAGTISEPANSLLETIKAQIARNLGKSSLNRELDDSITFSAHYSRCREIEGLHDFLLDQFNANQSLNANDIVVMCPDINDYSSYINAVFENQPPKQKIPFQVCGFSAQANNVANLMLEFVGLPETRYALNDIVDLLNHSYVKTCFELSTEEVEQIHSWLKQSQVCWGLDKTTLRQLDLPEYDRYTLQCGIDRMVLGLSLDGQSLALGDSLLFGLEGMSALHSGTLSKLIEFVDALKSWRDFCLNADGDHQSYSISEWCEQLRVMAEALISAPKQDADSLNSWYRLLNDLEHAFINSDRPPAYSYAFVKQLIAQKVEDAATSSSVYRYGRVNFGSFGVLKGVPAKVIAVLGMNETDFPRKPKADSIDLTLLHPQLGDRNPVEQDKDAFMVALLNCESHFYCSYIGRDIRSNNERIPSVVLQELLDFIQTDPEKQNNLVNLHPMNPYSEAYFQPDNSLFTYQNFEESLSSSNIELVDDTEIESLPEWELPPQISIQDLKTFLEDPAKAFFRVRFNIDLPSLDDESTGDEPLKASALTRWKYIDDLLRLGIQEQGISEELKARVAEPYKASAQMEHDFFAEKSFSEWNDTAESVLKNVLAAKGEKVPELMPVDLPLQVGGSNTRLVGELNLFSDDSESKIIQVIQGTAATAKEKYLMRAIVDTRVAEALVLENQSNYKSTYLASKNRLFYLSADKQSGRNSLAKWVGLYKEVMNTPIALDLELAREIKAEQFYREAFANALEEKTSGYSGGNLSEAFKLLSHDKKAVDRGEAYIGHYQYLKPGKAPEEDQYVPHWLEVKDGELS